MAPDSLESLFLYPSMSPDGATVYVESDSAIDNAGNLYVTVGNSELLSLTPEGTVWWRLSGLINGGYKAGPAIGWDGTVYFERNRGKPPDSLNFITVNPDGTTKFKLTLSDPDGRMPDLDSNPAITSKGKIYIGSANEPMVL